jgi:hypothetical protein
MSYLKKIKLSKCFKEFRRIILFQKTTILHLAEINTGNHAFIQMGISFLLQGIVVLMCGKETQKKAILIILQLTKQNPSTPVRSAMS